MLSIRPSIELSADTTTPETEFEDFPCDKDDDNEDDDDDKDVIVLTVFFIIKGRCFLQRFWLEKASCHKLSVLLS
jgi:hypothetical protein